MKLCSLHLEVFYNSYVQSESQQNHLLSTGRTYNQWSMRFVDNLVPCCPIEYARKWHHRNAHWFHGRPSVWRLSEFRMHPVCTSGCEYWSLFTIVNKDYWVCLQENTISVFLLQNCMFTLQLFVKLTSNFWVKIDSTPSFLQCTSLWLAADLSVFYRYPLRHHSSCNMTSGRTRLHCQRCICSVCPPVKHYWAVSVCL